MKQILNFPNLPPEKARSALNRIVWFDGFENNTNPSSILREFSVSVASDEKDGCYVKAEGKMSNTVAAGLFISPIVVLSIFVAVNSTFGYISAAILFGILVIAPWILGKRKLSIISTALSTTDFVNSDDGVYIADQGNLEWLEWWLGLFVLPLTLVGIGGYMEYKDVIDYSGIEVIQSTLANAFIAGVVLLVVGFPLLIIWGYISSFIEDTEEE